MKVRTSEITIVGMGLGDEFGGDSITVIPKRSNLHDTGESASAMNALQKFMVLKFSRLQFSSPALKCVLNYICGNEVEFVVC